ncbi:hypothetical protein CCYA_CCYA04G1423 [Cyanidiococcus yangmingshanensis]|nr:hypothetical protein CCYA_CCYA04G1423 [Cyanidiococcus yangmingshanensis]
MVELFAWITLVLHSTTHFRHNSSSLKRHTCQFTSYLQESFRTRRQRGLITQRSRRKYFTSPRFRSVLAVRHFHCEASSTESSVNMRDVGKESAGDGDDLDGASGQHNSLRTLVLQPGFAERFPADPETRNYVRAVRNAAFSYVNPSPTWTEPTLVAWSKQCALDCLDLVLRPSERELAARVFSGMTLVSGSRPYAQRYGGHQFGSWAGQLGDGRVIVLGEYRNRASETWTLQLKGAGKTPYARFADGRAVLRSSVREFLASEALHALGIPTSRALSLVLTNDTVVRDMFYDGHPREEPGAVVCRLAPSWVRFGTFELATDWKELDLLRNLADDTIEHHYPHLLAGERPDRSSLTDKGTNDNETRSQFKPMLYRAFLKEVAQRTAILVAGWQSVGFVHGVLNTDNMSILGLTIDYGPYGFLDAYAPEYTPNTTDLPGRRYCYALQPTICLWNLIQLAQAFEPLIEVDLSEEISQIYEAKFREEMSTRLQAKLGFRTWNPERDHQLVRDLYELMRQDSADFTRTWRALSWLEPSSCVQATEAALEPLSRVLPESVWADTERHNAWRDWVQRYAERSLAEGPLDATLRRRRMQSASPKYILRNYMAQQAIDKAETERDFSEIDRLLKLLRHPFDEQPDMEAAYDRAPPAWAERLGVCMNSCSS